MCFFLTEFWKENNTFRVWTGFENEYILEKKKKQKKKERKWEREFIEKASIFRKMTMWLNTGLQSVCIYTFIFHAPCWRKVWSHALLFGFLMFFPLARCLPPRKFQPLIHGPPVSRRHVMTTQGLFLNAHSKRCYYSIKKNKIPIKDVMALLKHLCWCHTASLTFTLVSGRLYRPSEVHGEKIHTGSYGHIFLVWSSE